MSQRVTHIFLSSESLKKYLDELSKGSFEEQALAEKINGVMDRLKIDHELGVKIPRRLWPKPYFEHLQIESLWKCDLDSNWRLIYSTQQDEIRVACIVLEWLRHKDYERKFNYHRT